jgi:hypothetical protein
MTWVLGFEPFQVRKVRILVEMGTASLVWSWEIVISLSLFRGSKHEITEAILDQPPGRPPVR